MNSRRSGHSMPGACLLGVLVVPAVLGVAPLMSAHAADSADLALHELESDPRLDPLARAAGLDTRRSPLRLDFGAAPDTEPEPAPAPAQVSAPAPTSAESLRFQDDSDLHRRVTTLAREGLPLFPVRRGMLDGDLVFGVSRRGTLGLFLAPRKLE